MVYEAGLWFILREVDIGVKKLISNVSVKKIEASIGEGSVQ